MSSQPAASAEPITMPVLTDRMRAVLRNDGDVYGSEDELYVALVDAAQAQGKAAPVAAQASGPTTTCNGMPAYEGPLSAAQASGQAQYPGTAPKPKRHEDLRDGFTPYMWLERRYGPTVAARLVDEIATAGAACAEFFMPHETLRRALSNLGIASGTDGEIGADMERVAKRIIVAVAERTQASGQAQDAELTLLQKYEDACITANRNAEDAARWRKLVELAGTYVTFQGETLHAPAWAVMRRDPALRRISTYSGAELVAAIDAARAAGGEQA